MMGFRRFVFLFVLFPVFADAQTIQVRQESARIEGESFSGYQLDLAAAEEEVRNALTRYLKTLGKVKTSGDYLTIAAPVVAGKKYPKALYATSVASGNAITTWFGVALEAGEESSLHRDLEKLAYDFGVSFHRGKIQENIDESLQALEAVEKQKVRIANQHKDLNNRIERNKREKIELEKSLVNNKLELENLTKTLATNVKAADSVAVATEQIRKVVEMHRERQRKVE